MAVKDGLIAGVSRSYRGKKEIDLGGRYLAPGYIDAHLHLESTMVTPNELVCTAAKHGTTTFIVDPHEAANVSGAAGIDYILNQTEDVDANVFVMMPSVLRQLRSTIMDARLLHRIWNLIFQKKNSRTG